MLSQPASAHDRSIQVAFDELLGLCAREADSIREEIDVLLRVDEAQKRDERLPFAKRIGERVAIGMSAGKGNEVFRDEKPVGLLFDLSDDVGIGDSRLEVLRFRASTRVRRGLEADARHPRAGRAVADDCADLMIIHTALQRAGQR